MEQQLEECKSQLAESQKMNLRLGEQLQKISKNRPEELSGQNRLNEQQKQEISLLREELQKVNNVCDELRTAAKKADAEMSSYKKEHESEFKSLKRTLEDSQKVIAALQGRLKKQREVKEKQASLDQGSLHVEPDGAVDGRSSESPRGRQVSQLQKELEEMYKKNEELRRSLSGDMELDELNRQLKQDLLKSQQKNALLGKQLEGSAKKLHAMTSEVNRLANELDRTHALCIDYASQLKALRDQNETSGRVRKNAGNDVDETLKSEIQRLTSSLKQVEEENER